MTNVPKLFGRTAVPLILAVAAWLAVSAVAASGQAEQSQKLAYAADPANVPDAIAKVKSGGFAPVHLEMIAKFHAVQAIPALKEQFNRSHDDETKDHIASVLVRLGETNETYWKFIVDYADKALDSNPPDVASATDSHGKPSREPPPQIVEWAKEHHLSIEDAGEELLFKIPEAITMLGATGDNRAVPVLLRALSSRDFMVQVAAARGLAAAKDSDSIPVIIAACRKASPEVAQMIATSLIYFDDPDAQKAADEFLPKDFARILREERAQGQNPF